MDRPRLLLAALAALTLLTTPTVTWAQAPGPGDYYEDSVELGFKIRMPKGWSFAPAQPGDLNTIGTYAPPNVRYVNISGDEVLWLRAHLVKFDRREPEAPPGGESRRRPRAIDTLESYLEAHYSGNGVREIESGEFRMRGVDATQYVYSATLPRGGAFNLWAVQYSLAPDLDVAVIFNAPARDLRRWQNGFRRMAQSFRVVEVSQQAEAEGRSGDSAYRTEKRAQLEREVARNPGWELHETDNYFVVSSVNDRAFMRELLTRLEAIRAVYEELYPVADAERIRLLARNRELAEKAEKEKKDKEKEDGDEPDAGSAEPAAEEPEDGEGPSDEPAPPPAPSTRSTTSPQELSRCSVVRVCTSREQYQQYGGPLGSAGYWNSAAEELVIFDDKAVGGRSNTWAVLNHEAFHQYIFYFYGNIAPHYWYNEGHGDFFSGYHFQHGRFTLRKFDWRVGTIQQMLRTDEFVPLREFVRFGRPEYYAGTRTKWGTTIGEHYAQGWSFIYFLRTARRSIRCWDSSWESILDVYFETLAATGDLDAAVDEAFQGVDWQQLEDCWKSYTQS